MSTWQIFSDAESNYQWQISEVNRKDASNGTPGPSPTATSRLPSMRDLLLQACSNGNEGTLMFRTGLGKSVRLTQSSVPKALSVLGEDADADVCQGSISTRESTPLLYPGEEHAIDNSCSFSNSLFKTGSGKAVTISSNGLVRAKTLLGLKEDIVGSNIQSPQQSTKLHAIGETDERRHSPHLPLHKSVNSYRMMNALSCQSPSVGSSHTLKNDFEIEVVQPDMYGSTAKQAPIKFHTAGGRSISVSNDALQRARSLLGDPDLGDFFDGGDAGGSIFPLLNVRRTNTTSTCDRSDCDTPLINQLTSESNHMTKSFTLPLLSSRKKDAKFLCEGSGNNLIMKFDAVENESDYSLKSSTCGQTPLHDGNQAPDSTAYHSSLNGFSSKVDPPRMSLGRPLVNISNTINKVHTNNRQPASGKRRLGSRETVSPFKRPRSTKCSIPYDQDVGVFPNGEEHAIDNSCSFSHSLFKTGSGKTVTISSNGLVSAKTLLGLKEDIDGSNIQRPQHATKLNAIGETYERHHSPHLQLHKSVNSYRTMNAVSCQSPSVGSSHTLKNDFEIEVVQPDMYGSTSKQAPIKFPTAGGRSISVSNDALQRARSLLGDPDLGDFFDGGNAGDSIFSLPNVRQTNTSSSCDRSDCDTPLIHQLTTKSNHMTKCFTLPLLSSRQNDAKFLGEGIGNNLIMKFDAVGNESDNSLKSSITCGQRPLHDGNQAPDSTAYHSSLNGFSSKVDPPRMSIGRPLVDISNTINTVHTNNRQPASGKQRLGSRVTVSPFKRPRNSKISVPYGQDVGVFPNGLSQLSCSASGCKRKVSTLYPLQYPRMHIKDFFAVPSLYQKAHFRNQVRQVTSGNAENYMFHYGSGESGMGAEAFVHLLAQHGASTHFASKEWVLNHYKWIVWKLACYERFYPARSNGNFLSVSNVLEELKYRYEREVNHGHRSSLKKILEGDALPSSMMILCISTIHSNHGPESVTFYETRTGTQSSEAVIVELTDGWYSMNAILDVPLSKQLASGRLFVGQKLRIWGARLCGWNGPVSPLEVSSTVSLLLHINGTYRAHWAERLGFCKVAGPPLAFRCVKSNGGLIPQTLAGITRIYPILYKERLSSGRSVVISEKMENKMMELYNQRCSAVVESITSEYQNERSSHINYESDSEGAKIYKMLETVEEPEFLMADMSPEQLSSFASYKAKLKAIRQSEMEKSIEKALKDAGLRKREVTPFMRLRVVGLTYKTRQDRPKEGIITIWNPTEKQRQELVEGEAYAIAGLMPSRADLDILHLQTSGSSTKWLPLSSKTREQFKPFFSNRKAVSLSSLRDIPLSYEFDIAAYVVHVGEVYTSSQQKKQWVFVTDGSIRHDIQSKKLINSLLAICFCSPSIDYDSYPPINYNLAGSTVCFFNLIKKAKDHANHIWVADATENSTYCLTFDFPHCSHLRNAASSTRRWAANSSLTIGKIKEKVLSVVGDRKG